MKLKPGIKIYGDNLEDTLEINSGVVHHSKHEPVEIIFNDNKFRAQYEPDAHLAKRDWRKLSSQELHTVKGDHVNKKDYNSVFIGEIPEELKHIFNKLNLHSAISDNDAFQKFIENKEVVQELNTHLNAVLEKISLAPYRFMSIATNYPNSEVVSLNKRKLPENYTFKDIHFIGVHKDSSKDMTLHTCYRYGNRFTINLGEQPRYFLFINLTMKQAYKMLKEKVELKDVEITNENITDYFLKHYPDYPVIKVKQEPYQFYIAPTDNCFHDGTTIGNTAIDVVITYLGKFCM
ncbi:hypothetical protein [Chryseobacterium shigense]|uniref:Uncharacterized protein n=1 Tax=Chryseobacterium shigense TaxID=297244 RepID=A0A841NDU1_9FLAO|nr:hypothetical protein [Chryseobacterium shigense]MBB6369519.1 hypothetical protein [Chryseobacterium shigense]